MLIKPESIEVRIVLMVQHSFCVDICLETWTILSLVLFSCVGFWFTRTLFWYWLLNIPLLLPYVFICRQMFSYLSKLWQLMFSSVLSTQYLDLIRLCDDCQCRWLSMIDNFLLYRIRPIISHCKASAAFLSWSNSQRSFLSHTR